MQIGRKIYYEKLNGNLLIDTGEREGDVVETTRDQDFASYVVLSERVPDAVGMIQIAFGQDRDKFGVYSFHVESDTIVWDLTPTQAEEVTVEKTTAEKIAELEAQNAQIIDALAALTGVSVT